MKRIVNKIRYVKVSDIFSFFIFIVVFPISIIFRIINKIRKRHLWLICEDGKTARDNGYHFYKYIRQNYKNDYCFYVIDKKSADYNKVKEYGNIIQFKSFKHWLFYLSSEYNISIHKHGNPCQSFFYVIHVLMNLYNNRVFLQHGITKDDSKWLYYKKTKFRYFICGARNEYEYILRKFGYPEENVIYTGFPRFDNLHNCKTNEKQILIMPTWRNWFGGNYFSKNEFIKSDYFNTWNSLLNNAKFLDYINKHDILVYFYPHQHIQKFISEFKTNSHNIKIVDNSTVDIQKLLIQSQLLITDYSSVFMDFAYMKKPIIYYQFDYSEYRKMQLQEGYFSYKEDGFGDVLSKESDIIDKVIFYNDNYYKSEQKYEERMNSFFEIHDDNNCKRIYEILRR